jgi:cysteine desulfurase/selenocysteine lyase
MSSPREPQQKRVVHLNAAGASVRSAATTSAVIDYWEDETRRGAYELVSTHRRQDLERPYVELAALLGCSADEISIVSSATEAWNEIIHGLAWTCKEGDGIATSVTEYGSNYLTYLQLKKRHGIRRHVVGETEVGDLDVAALEDIISRERIVLISLPHVPTSSGRVYDVEKIGAIASKRGVLFLLDACQSVGQMEVDVRRINCDFLTGTGRKYLRAPRGTGFLFCRRERQALFEPGSIDVHSARWIDQGTYGVTEGSTRFEKYELSYASKVGLGVAVREVNEAGIRSIQTKIFNLAGFLRNLLSDVDEVCVRDRGAMLCGIVSFSVRSRGRETEKERTEALFEQLCEAGYSVSLSRACRRGE